VSYDPYALDAVKAAEHAANNGAAIIALTDTTLSPVARYATRLLILPTASTSYYQSLVPTMALLEGLVTYLVARGGPKMVQRIKEEFERRDNFGVYWRDGD
jgi:DNA-binding MurR/RpiR family transcriptional regulator